MSRVHTTTAANIIVLGLVAMGSTPALAANYHDYHPWSRPNNSVLVNYHPGHAGPGLFHGCYYSHPVGNKREPRRDAKDFPRVDRNATLRCLP